MKYIVTTLENVFLKLQFDDPSPPLIPRCSQNSKYCFQKQYVMSPSLILPVFMKRIQDPSGGECGKGSSGRHHTTQMSSLWDSQNVRIVRMLKYKSDCFRDLCPYTANKNSLSSYPSSLLQGTSGNALAGNPCGTEVLTNSFSFLWVSDRGIGADSWRLA